MGCDNLRRLVYCKRNGGSSGAGGRKRSLSVLEETTYDNRTIRYEGHGHVIRDNLTLKNTTYLRLLGGSATTSDSLSFGPADDAAKNQRPVVTIQGNSGFYATYRNGDKVFLDDKTDKSVVQSYLIVNVGENGGSGLFLVQSVGGSFSSNINSDGLWLWQLTVSENATSDGDYIDILQKPMGTAKCHTVCGFGEMPAATDEDIRCPSPPCNERSFLIYYWELWNLRIRSDLKPTSS